MSINVTVEAAVNPTEDESKVQRALLNIFPNAKVERHSKRDDVITLRIQGLGFNFLSTFRNIIRQERIREAARRILMSKVEGDHITIFLHKQAAFVGRISFCGPEGESPLGPISIKITTPSPESVVDYLAATGKDGFQRFRET
ncbi:MAG: RNA-binding domain-containing protein [Candidatus Bathyarchaeia archaeon]|jgi:predicted RNA binding protein with dsRBD fold (UPF0201 family)